MVSTSGYEIVEPEILGDWLGVVRNRAFMVAFLTWLIDQVTKKLMLQHPDMCLQVIKVEYVGAYPAIGIKNGKTTPENSGMLVEASINQTLVETPVFEFVRYVFESDVDWEKVTNELMGNPNTET